MRGRTFALSQKELQRVSVISACVKGDMACASRRRLPAQMHRSILRLARTTYAGFNDHHLCEKLCEVEGFSLSRETLRRLLRRAGLGSPRQRRAPAHRQRRLRSAREGELVQLDGSPHDWLEGRGPLFTALGLQDDATGKILAAHFFPTESAFGNVSLLRQMLCRYGVPLAFYGDRSSIFQRNDDSWSIREQLAGKRDPTQFGRALEQLGITFIAARSPQAKGRVERLWGVLQDRLCSELRLAQACDLDSAMLSSPASSPTTTAVSPVVRGTWQPPGAPLLTIWTASAASFTPAWSATTMSCNGRGDAFRSPRKAAASASLGPRSTSTTLSTAASRFTTAKPNYNSPWLHQGDIFMLPLG
jgi:hypothetical protein